MAQWGGGPVAPKNKQTNSFVNRYLDITFKPVDAAVSNSLQ